MRTTHTLPSKMRSIAMTAHPTPVKTDPKWYTSLPRPQRVPSMQNYPILRGSTSIFISCKTSVNNGYATGCIDRAHEELTVSNLSPGTYYVIADTWSNSTQEFAGEYRLSFEWRSDDQWNEVPLDEGSRGNACTTPMHTEETKQSM